jgi:hypothetical protein
MRWKRARTGWISINGKIAHQDQTPLDILIANAESGARKSADSLEELLSAVTELQVLVSARKR